MKIVKKFFENKIILIEFDKHKDKRGFFTELYNAKIFREIGIEDKFNQDNYSYSKKKGIIRGLHFQNSPFAQSKLISVIKGRILDVVVDIRKTSPTYGHYEKFILSKRNCRQLYVSSGFAHGFQTLDDDTEVLYKVSSIYSKDHEGTIYWNDPDLSIKWNKHAKAQVNIKDKNGILFKNFNSKFK